MIRELALAGVYAAEIARRTGIPQGTVNRIRNTHLRNVAFASGVGVTKREPTAKTMRRVARIRELAEAGLYAAEIARRVGIAEPEVQRLRRRHLPNVVFAEGLAASVGCDSVNLW